MKMFNALFHIYFYQDVTVDLCVVGIQIGNVFPQKFLFQGIKEKKRVANTPIREFKQHRINSRDYIRNRLELYILKFFIFFE